MDLQAIYLDESAEWIILNKICWHHLYITIVNLSIDDLDKQDLSIFFN